MVVVRASLALAAWALAAPCLAQEPAPAPAPPVCVVPGKDGTPKCYILECDLTGSCGCPLAQPDGRKLPLSDAECRELRRSLPARDPWSGVQRTVLPTQAPEKEKEEKKEKKKNVDLVTPERRRHILDGEEGDPRSGGHRPGTGRPSKTEFPKDWSDEKIIHEISDVATDPASAREPGQRGRTVVEGTRDGVHIRVIVEKDGTIVTGYPLNTPKNP